MREREPNPFQSPDKGGDFGGTPEAPKKPEQFESAEKVLSTEVVEEIMAKVEDIDMPGTAYSVVNDPYSKSGNNIESMLGAGLAPIGVGDKVHFNIVGRIPDIDRHKEKREIAASYWVKKPGTVTIMFDISELTEIVPQFEGRDPIPDGTYRAVGPGMNRTVEIIEEEGNIDIATDTPVRNQHVVKGIEKIMDREERLSSYYEKKGIKPLQRRRYLRDGQFTPDTEYGFVTEERISSKKFRGLVIRPTRLQKGNEIDQSIAQSKAVAGIGWNQNIEKQRRKESSEILVADTDPEHLQEEANLLAIRVVRALQGLDKQDRLIPIYDIQGNLLWPKQMSHEEVKQCVAERETRKLKPKQKY